jgi:hypothetical protein
VSDSANLPLGAALRRHYAASGLPQDGGHSATHWALVQVGFLVIPLGNFRWRRNALRCHDIHHLLTGYPCTLAGELQFAAWEFAAGRFAHALSTLYCMRPLLGVGALVMPARSFAAFVRGRRSRTLYATPISGALLAASVGALRQRFLPRTPPVATMRDVAAYAGLALVSLTLIALPLALLALLFFNYA